MKRPSIQRGKRRVRRASFGRLAAGLDRVSEHVGQVGGQIPDQAGAMKVAWAAAVGGNLSRRSRPAGMVGSRLVVEVPDSTWQRAIQSNSGRIEERLRASLGAKAPSRIEVRVVQGMFVPAKEKSSSDSVSRPPCSEEEMRSSEVVEDVRDPALRAAIARAYRAHCRAFGCDPAPKENAKAPKSASPSDRDPE